MADAENGEPLPRPTGRGRWTSFVADPADGEKPVRGMHEQANPKHRVRVEHDQSTLFIHLSDEDGRGWTTLVVDRATRRWAVAQETRQGGAAEAAYDQVYEAE